MKHDLIFPHWRPLGRVHELRKRDKRAISESKTGRPKGGESRFGPLRSRVFGRKAPFSHFRQIREHGLRLIAAFCLLALPVKASEEPILAFDFNKTVEADRTGKHPAAFFEGNSLATPSRKQSGDGQCLSFDGKQGLVVASKGLRFDERNLTIEARVYLETLPSQGNAVIASQAGRFILAVRPGGRVSAQLLTLPNRVALTSTGDDKLTAGAWHTVSASYDGRQALLSLDGKVVGNQESAGTLAGSSNPLVVGARFSLPGDFTNPGNQFLDGFEGLVQSVTILRATPTAESP